MERDKKLYIISGCNGAGKTTVSYTVFPDVLKCEEFVNADEIAKGLSPFHPESVAIEAGMLMLKRIDDLLEQGVNFAIETTLAARSYVRLVEKAHQRGYEVRLIFLWLSSPEMAVERVAQRVREGGHNIPEDVVQRRYHAGLSNLFNIFMDQVDYWLLMNNSKTPRSIVAEGGLGMETKIYDTELFDYLKGYVVD